MDTIHERISDLLEREYGLELAVIRLKARSEGGLAGMLACLLGLAVAYEAMFPLLGLLGVVVLPKDCPGIVWLAVPLIVTLLGTVMTIRALPKDRPAIATTSESDGDAARTRKAVAPLRNLPRPPPDYAQAWARILVNAICAAPTADLVYHHPACWELTNAMLDQVRALADAPDALVETRELLAIALHTMHAALPGEHYEDDGVELLAELRELVAQNRTSVVIAAQLAKSLNLEIRFALGPDDTIKAHGLLEEMRRWFSAGALPCSGDSEDAYASSVFAVFANTGELELLNELRCLAHGGGPSVHMKVLLGLALTRHPMPGVSDSAELQNLFAGIQEQAEYERRAQLQIPDQHEERCWSWADHAAARADT